jgi:hypothetical protein
MNTKLVPPLLIIKDPHDLNFLHSNPISIRSGATNGLTSVKNNNQGGANMFKYSALSPGSTLSMQHIQIPTNYRSPLANNASNFTLSNALNNEHGSGGAFSNQRIN